MSTFMRSPKLFVCEFLDCESTEKSSDLPKGWSQCGETRYVTTRGTGRYACWCPVHSNRAAMEAHDEMMAMELSLQGRKQEK